MKNIPVFAIRNDTTSDKTKHISDIANANAIGIVINLTKNSKHFSIPDINL